MYVKRDLQTTLVRVAREYPIVTVTGPRQSGKTTLCRRVFPRRPYVNLELPDQREFAQADPRGFLAHHAAGAVLDEVQHVPDLLSWLQADVDEDSTPGRWILTGSEHLGLTRTVSQSLAGRSATLFLHPLSWGERGRFPDPPEDLLTALWQGGWPRIHAQGMDAARWMNNYIRDYLQRDVRRLLAVGDMEAFTRFMRLLAGRTAQEINLSALGGDVGVSHNTIRSWISILEASLLVVRVPAWARSHRKRLVKTAKLHWMDSGLVCALLGIRTPDDLRPHPLRGAIFETWVASEIVKAHTNRGRDARMHHLRQARGLEVDLLVDTEAGWRGVECKSGATVASDALRGLRALPDALGPNVRSRRGVLVHGGDMRQVREGVELIPWHGVGRVRWGTS